MATYINEEGYFQLIADILDVNCSTPDRTKCGTQKTFSADLFFPDVKVAFPLFTGRPVPFRLCFEELMFFMRGRVQTKELEEKGIMFWHANTTRQFLDDRGLTYLPEGHYGYAYGAVMRHAGGTYDENFNPVGGFDQLDYVINELKTNPWSRRALIELWDPRNIANMALTPCCHTYNFTASMGDDGIIDLNLDINVRSSDVLFGLGGANAPAFGFLLMAMAKLVGLRPKALNLHLVDAHIYSGGYADQIEYAKEAITREISPLPQMTITKELNTMEDLLSLEISDIMFSNYNPNKTKMVTPRPPMAA